MRHQAKKAAIVIESLSKRYKGSDKLALNNLSLKVYPGEVYGFLGPNGAGKSTTIRLLMNFLAPTDGVATILGDNCTTNSVHIKRTIGYLSGDMSMYPKMTGKQYLNYMSELQPNSDEAFRRELTQKLKATMDKKLGELSRGNRQKIGIIQAFMHKPKVMLLDEPTSGLDPIMQEVFYKLLDEVKSRGTAVFVSSHVLSEVQKMCDRVGIIRDGELVNESDIAKLATEAAQTFDITFAQAAPVAALKKLPGVRVVAKNGSNITLHVHGNLSKVFSVLAHNEVLAIDTRTLDLEEVFLHYYQGEEAKQ